MKNYQTVKRTLALTPSTAASTVTVAGNVIDCKGADYATIEVLTNKSVNSSAVPITVKVQHSDTTTTSDFVDINTNTLQTTLAMNSTDARIAAMHVNLNGTKKRYLRIFITPGTNSTNDPVVLGAIANLEMDVRPAGTVGQADAVAIG
jgi:hypothetical protein